MSPILIKKENNIIIKISLEEDYSQNKRVGISKNCRCFFYIPWTVLVNLGTSAKVCRKKTVYFY